MVKRGVLIGCDQKQQWLLPWWWKHFRSVNDLPVALIDFGMDENGISWCIQRGIYFRMDMPPLISEKRGDFSEEKRLRWEKRYGKGIWRVRSTWMKKPLAFLQTPFDQTVWIDLDAQIKKNISSIFDPLDQGFDLALVKEPIQDFEFLLPGEINYNSGVMAFSKASPFLYRFIEFFKSKEGDFPGDQDLLNRAIFLFQPSVFELSPIYNWCYSWGENANSVVFHYSGGAGKKALLDSVF